MRHLQSELMLNLNANIGLGMAYTSIERRNISVRMRLPRSLMQPNLSSRRDSMMLFGRILQHDDDIPSPELNKAFRGSSYDWKVLTSLASDQGGVMLSVVAESVPYGLLFWSHLYRVPSYVCPGSKSSGRKTTAQSRLYGRYLCSILTSMLLITSVRMVPR